MSQDQDNPRPHRAPMTLSEIAASETVTVLRTDAVVAQAIRDELGPPLDQICEIMGRAKADGYIVSWNMQADSFGRRFRVTEISIVKPL